MRANFFYYLSRLFIVLVISFTVSCQKDSSSKQADGALRPNIIYIMADDLGYGDLGCFGQKNIRTPFLDSMAAEGMIFTQYYSGGPVCTPSRCVLMTGKHTGHAYLRANTRLPLSKNETTVAELLKKAGYTNALIGKWALGEIESPSPPLKRGFDHFVGYLLQIRAHNSYPEWLWKGNDTMKLNNKVETIPVSYAKGVGGYAVEKKTNVNEVFTDESINFIKENKDNPFFLYLALNVPHGNNEAWYWDSPGLEVPEMMGYDTTSWPEPLQSYAALVTYIDQNMGKILSTLRELEIDTNTLVIFTSDNGPHCEAGADPNFFNSSRGFRGMKRDLYEGGIRMPMIAWWPGHIAANTQSDHLSGFWDFLPTACELAGIEAPKDIDGISFLPTLLGKQQKEHPYLYWEFNHKGGRQAIRKEKWKAVRYDIGDDPDKDVELYDLSIDPSESKDLSDQYPDVALDLKNEMAKARTRPELDIFRFDFEK